MLGAVAGDIIGSIYEFNNVRTEQFPLFSSASHFTDDTVLSVAIADSILTGVSFKEKLLEYANRYPDMSYGGRFIVWMNSKDHQPYGSYGNGSAMRVSPVGWAYNNLEEVLAKAAESAEVTHNHPEGIKGAQAVAASIFMARKGADKREIEEYVTSTFEYDLSFDLEDLRKRYKFEETCQDSVPQAIFTFLQSRDFETAIRKAVSIGGDSDTIACISGSIAEAYYGGLSEPLKAELFERLDDHLAGVISAFIKKYRT